MTVCFLLGRLYVRGVINVACVDKQKILGYQPPNLQATKRYPSVTSHDDDAQFVHLMCNIMFQCMLSL